MGNKIDKILDVFYWEAVNRPVKGIDEDSTDELDIITTHKQNITNQASQAFTELIRDIAEEIIGADEGEIVQNLLPGMPYIEKRESNRLRQSQRDKLEALLK